MRKILLVIIFLTISFSGFIKIHASNGSEINQAPYQLAFTSCGANLLESHINCWAKINIDSSDLAITNKLLNLLNTNSIQATPEEIKMVKEPEKIMAVYNDPASGITFSIINILAENLSYFVIETNGDISKYNQQTELIERFTQNTYFIVYYEFTGEIDRVLSPDEQKRVLSTIMQDFHSKSVQFYEDQNVISVTGYSQEIEKSIKTVQWVNKKYNLQAAVRSNPQQGKTKIYFGYPLLLNNY